MHQHRQQILKAIRIGLTINILLTIIKLSAGYFFNSKAIFSDGLNSFSDVFISVMLLFVLKVSTKKPDHDHPYGHEKYEGLAYFFIGIIFSAIAVFIFIESIVLILGFNQTGSQSNAPHILTVVVASIALIIKSFLYLYYRKVSKLYDTPTLKADAQNHLIDIFATSISLIGVVLAQFNLVIFDYIASIVIGLLILRLGVQTLFESVSYLVDQAPSDEELKEIKDVIKHTKGVLTIDDIKVRKHMTQKYVDVEIGVISTLSLEEAHAIAESVHHDVEKEFPEVLHCMVHVNPHKVK